MGLGPRQNTQGESRNPQSTNILCPASYLLSREHRSSTKATATIIFCPGAWGQTTMDQSLSDYEQTKQSPLRVLFLFVFC